MQPSRRTAATVFAAALMVLAAGCGASSAQKSPPSASAEQAHASTAATAPQPEDANPDATESAEPKPDHQTVRLAGIDVFGTEQPHDEIQAALDFKLGASFTFPSDTFRSRTDAAEAQLRERFGFAFVKLSVISYFAGPNAGEMYLTVDIVDADDKDRMAFAPAPQQDIADPAGLIATWLEYETRAWERLRSGDLEMPDGKGRCRGGFHCALGFGHPTLTPAEDRFIAEVPAHLSELRKVLVHSADAEQRAAAAYLLAYASDRKQVIASVLPAIRDPNALVRNNVLRVLVGVQEDAKHALLPLDELLAALDFPQTTDRNKAAYAILHTVRIAPEQYRSRVLDAVGEQLLAMAALTQPNNRDPALEILRVLSGTDHGDDIAAWRRWVEEARKPQKDTATSPRR